MQIGVVFPQYEIAPDPGAIKEYTQAVEAMGFKHMVAIDHVLGANRRSRPEWKATYDLDTIFHEPFTLFSFMAGITEKLGFITGVIILPQRQTALVAKQTACLDVLSRGRFRLGIGTGWNQVEYEALGMSFTDRGKMFDDQIEVLRALWTTPAVTIKTKYHTITDAGINPLPVQRPIPIWFGGGNKTPANLPGNAVEKVMRRIARIGDGWMPPFPPEDEAAEALAKLRGYCNEYQREPGSVGIEGFMLAYRKGEANWANLVSAWRKLGATHLAINAVGDGLRGVDQHLKRLEEVRQILPPNLLA